MTQAVTNFSVAPVPAKQALPQWYKEASPYVYDEKEIGMHPNPNAGISNATIKACVPFLDAMTTGYMITLVSDIELRKTDKKEILIRWSQPYLNMVEGHHPDKIETLPLSGLWNIDWMVILINPLSSICISTEGRSSNKSSSPVVVDWYSGIF